MLSSVGPRSVCVRDSKHRLVSRPILADPVYWPHGTHFSHGGSHCKPVVANAAPKAGAKGAPSAKGFGPPKPQPRQVLDPESVCLCGSRATYGTCCGQYHAGLLTPVTAEQLLRSRYTAYAIKNAEYIADTTSMESVEFTGSRSVYIQSVKATMKRAEWHGLEITELEKSQNPNEAFIKFTAQYTDNVDKAKGRQSRSERAHFVREPKTQAWQYMGSEMIQPGLTPFGTLSLPSLKL